MKKEKAEENRFTVIFTRLQQFVTVDIMSVGR